MNVTEQEFKFMVQSLVADLITLLMQEERMTMPEAFDTLYQSNVFAKLSEPTTGLYYQAPRYVFSYLKEEMAVAEKTLATTGDKEPSSRSQSVTLK